mgnify:CR=1 FL=1
MEPEDRHRRCWYARRTAELPEDLGSHTIVDGHLLYCAHWMELHPDFKKGGRMAVSYYDRGTRFVKVGTDGKVVALMSQLNMKELETSAGFGLAERVFKASTSTASTAGSIPSTMCRGQEAQDHETLEADTQAADNRRADLHLRGTRVGERQVVVGEHP